MRRGVRVGAALAGAPVRLAHAKAGMAQVPAVDETIQKVGSTFRNHFVSKLSKPRTIGREAEFPVVTSDGTAADVRKLLARMDEDGDLRLKQAGDWGLYGEEYEYRWVMRQLTGLVPGVGGCCGQWLLAVDVVDGCRCLVTDGLARPGLRQWVRRPLPAPPPSPSDCAWGPPIHVI